MLRMVALLRKPNWEPLKEPTPSQGTGSNIRLSKESDTHQWDKDLRLVKNANYIQERSYA
jgi:hypothetical protein